jgi:hypothetical protein
MLTMTFSKAKREFDIRYYLWATSEFEKEIEESFPTLRLFKAGGAWKTHQFMLQLSKSDQLALARSLLKRFHPNAVKALGETCSTEEESLRSRRDASTNNILSFGEEIRARKNAGEQIKLASKRKLRKVMTAKFKAAFGHECIGLACVDEEPDLRFKIKRSGWIINTFFDFGRSQTILNYSHNIESEKTFPYRGGEVGMGMGAMMSFNSYLGISSQTQWHYITDEEIEPRCATALKLCAHLFDVLPKLLKGLECETVTPDEGYELSDNPLR